ncbi:MAG: hypothetical protein ABIH47_05455 [Candidatus Omnitrophota bacterium]
MAHSTNGRTLTGFTLIEILLVVLLISIFTGLVIPRVGVLFFNYELHSTIEKIEKLIHYAQQSPVLDGTVYKMSIEREEKRFSLFSQQKQDKKEEFEKITGKGSFSIRLPKNMELSDLTSDEIFFFPDGSSTIAQFSICYNNDQTVSFTIPGYLFGLKVTFRE